MNVVKNASVGNTPLPLAMAAADWDTRKSMSAEFDDVIATVVQEWSLACSENLGVGKAEDLPDGRLPPHRS
jgi:hypothetical protein